MEHFLSCTAIGETVKIRHQIFLIKCQRRRFNLAMTGARCFGAPNVQYIALNTVITVYKQKSRFILTSVCKNVC